MNLASTLTIGATDQPSQQSTPIRRHVSSLWPRGNAAGGQLVRLRWLAVSAAVMAVAIGDALDVFDDPGSVLGVAMALAALNAAWATGLLSGRFTAGIRTQLLVDLTALTLLLHFAGGVANPLVMLYLVHAILAAILLPRRQSYLVAAYACMAFKIVAVGEMLGWLAHHGLHLTAAAPPITASLAMNPRYVLLLIGTCVGLMAVSVYFVAEVMEGLRSREAALRSTRQQLHTAINSIQDGIVLFDHRGAPLACNVAMRRDGCACARAATHGGIRPGAAPDCPACPQWPFHRDPEAALQAFARGSKAPVTTETKAADRRYRHRLFPVAREADGVSLVWVREDVTEQRQLEAQARSQDRMAAVGVLAAGMAHEIRNPLASISAIVEDVRMTSPDTATREDLSTVGSQVHRISRILGELNGFARPPSAERGAVDLVEVVHEALRICHFDPRSREVHIVEELDSPLPEIHANRDQLLQVCINLILNALEAMSGRGTLTVTALEREGGVEMRVRDTGPGLPAAVAERVFDPFFTTKSKGQGAGLGLSVSANIVRAHGGCIGVDSEPGAGATFRVRLPRRSVMPAGRVARAPIPGLDPGRSQRPAASM